MRRFLPAHPNTNGDSPAPAATDLLSSTCWRRLIFFALRAALNFACGALFRENSAMTREAGIIGSEIRGGQQSGAIEDLGPGQFGQCAESTLVPARA